MTYWEKWSAALGEVERLEVKYERQKERYLRRYMVTHPQADPSSAEIDWEQSRTAQTLAGASIWAHRRAQTYALAIFAQLALRKENDTERFRYLHV